MTVYVEVICFDCQLLNEFIVKQSFGSNNPETNLPRLLVAGSVLWA